MIVAGIPAYNEKEHNEDHHQSPPLSLGSKRSWLPELGLLWGLVEMIGVCGYTFLGTDQKRHKCTLEDDLSEGLFHADPQFF